MPLQFREVIEGICAVEFAGVNQAHIKVADFGTIQRFVKQRVLPVQNRFLQGSFTKVVVQRCAWLAQKQSQCLPVPQHVADGCLSRSLAPLCFPSAARPAIAVGRP